MERLSEIRLKAFTKKADDLIFGPKNHDYNDKNHDVLTMFPKGWASSYTFLNKHLGRLDVLLSNKRHPKNESVEDNFMDLFNYVRMAYVAWLDEESKK